MFIVATGTAIAIGAIGGIIANLASGFLQDAMEPEPPVVVSAPPPPEPTVFEIIFSFLPQVVMLVVIVCCVLMYMGILKRYEKKIITFIVPVAISIIYCLLSSIILRIFGVFEIVALGIYIMFTAVYVKISLDIFKGKSNLKFLVHKDSGNTNSK